MSKSNVVSIETGTDELLARRDSQVAIVTPIVRKRVTHYQTD